MPLVLIAALCRDKSNPFGNSDKCSQDGNAYISFGQWVGAIVLYTFVFQMLAPPPEGTFDIEDRVLPIKGHTDAANGTPEQLPLLSTEEPEQTPSESNNSKHGKVKKKKKNLFSILFFLIFRIQRNYFLRENQHQLCLLKFMELPAQFTAMR